MKRLIFSNRLRIVFSAAIAVLFLFSCAQGAVDGEIYPMISDESPKAMMSRSEAGAPIESEIGSISEDAPEEDFGGEPAAAGRKRVYNGSAGIIVDDVEDTRLKFEEIAVNSGGYVESSYTDYIVLRVPAARFEEIFEIILSSGRIEYSRVETRDVTDAYADIGRRLRTADETRNRLYALLRQSTDPVERARILREIGRLTEEIESLKQQIAIMDSRIAFSRISVQLIPRIQGGISREDIPFPWIAWLDPLVPAGEKLQANVELNPGADWAVFSKESVYMAENSSQGQLYISTIPNSPKGNGDFWQKALLHHLSPYYAQIDGKTVLFGETEVYGVEMISKDQWPFRYFVGIIPDGRKLHIVEIFSPDGGEGFEEIFEALAEGRIR